MGQPSRRIEHIIRSIRRDTGNVDYSSESGIPQRDIEEYIQDAQDDLQTSIINVHSNKAFPAQTTLNVVVNESEIELPRDFHSSGGLIKVEFSSSGNARDFYPLRQVDLGELNESLTGQPSTYSRRGDLLVVCPTPQASVSGGIRIEYVKQLPRPSTRRGQIVGVSLNTGNRTINSIQIDLTEESYDPTGLLEDDYMCVVSREGVMKMAAIPFSAIDTTTPGGQGLFTLVPGFVYQVGETAVAGDYVVSGRYASSHPQWPAQVERFLRRFGVLRVKMRDSNDDMIAEDSMLAELRAQIVEDYVSLNSDVIRVPEINEDE